MTIETQGFFSSETTRLRAFTRNVPECKPWFEFASSLNSMAMQLIAKHEVGLDDNQQIISTIQFIRAHQAFQSAVILSEHGLVGEARAMVRVAAEAVIAAFASAADSDFGTALARAHEYHQLTIANEILNDPDLLESNSPASIDLMRKLKRKLDSAKKDPDLQKRPQSINWKDLAHKHCKEYYHTIYRLMSVDGVHTTVDTLSRFIHADTSERKIQHIKRAPDLEGIVDTLNCACLTLIWAFQAFTQQFNLTALDETLRACLRSFRKELIQGVLTDGGRDEKEVSERYQPRSI